MEALWRPGPVVTIAGCLMAGDGALAAAEGCATVHVIGVAREIVQCPTGDAYDYCITRTNLVDRAGVLTGRLEFFEDSSTGMKHPEDPAIAIYAAVARITTEEGVLEMAERGVFDTRSLDYAGLATITGSDGGLAGFEGTLTNIGNSEGTLQIMGTICKE